VIALAAVIALAPLGLSRQDAPDLADLRRQAEDGHLLEVIETLRSQTTQDPDALRLLAWLEECAGRHEEAAVLLQRLLARDPADVDARRRLANAWWQLGRLDQALEAYRRLVSGSAGDPARLASLEGDEDRLTTQSREQRILQQKLARLDTLATSSLVAISLLGVAGILGTLRSLRRTKEVARRQGRRATDAAD